MTVLSVSNFSSEVEKHDGLCVIDLYADWCGPCKMLAPIISELEQENPDVKFCKINIEEERELADMFRVDSIPMIAFVKEDTFLDISVGYVPKETLAKLIEQYK